MSPRDRMIRRLHAEGCTRAWIMAKLGISKSVVDRLGLDFARHAGRREFPCPNGHNATVLGHRDRCCTVCGEPVEIPENWAFRDDGTIKAKKVDQRRGIVFGREIPDQRTDQILALEVERESTPRYLQAPIDEQLRRLRA